MTVSPVLDSTTFDPAASATDFARPRWGRAGAVYDLIVTVGFATPFSAAMLLAFTRWVHDVLDLAGAQLPAFDATALMFTSMFGTAVMMWAVARLLRPEPRFIAIDTVGRAVFASWMIWALLNGQSATIVVFLIGEVVWLVLQLSGLILLRRR